MLKFRAPCSGVTTNWPGKSQFRGPFSNLFNASPFLGRAKMQAL